MKALFKRSAALFLSVFILLGCLAMGAVAASPSPSSPPLTILFTHDTHDRFLPAAKEGGGEYGGYARLSTLLNQQRAEAAANGRPVVTLDAGDFSMGSLFQTIYATDAPEIRTLGAMGYDVATLGNHEFDYRQDGLAAMLNAAVQSGDPLPKLVQANYVTPNAPESTGGSELVKALANYGVTDYTVIERDGARVAVFGVLGVDADDSAPMSDMAFEPIADAAKRVVEEIKSKESVDYVVCLSHAGTNPDPKKSEDEQLAKAVPGIDVIISGHTHSVTPEPIVVNGTYIVSCGPYTENLGVLTLEKPDGKVAATDFKLIPIDESVADDPAIISLTGAFKPLVDQEYLTGYGMTFDQVLAHTGFDFTPISEMGKTQAEYTLGNLITDGYIYAVKQAEGNDYIPVDFAVVADGVVRASFATGDITVSDAFDVSSLGSGGDGTPGYPLISVWLTGKELKAAFEVDASVAPLMGSAQLYGSGMKWSFNTHRMIFDKITACAQVASDGSTKPLVDGQLYRCVTGLYSGQMLGSVNSKSFGILTITPKDAQGNPITNFEDHIIYNENGAEVKEWYALASYLASFPAEGGVSQVPAMYAQPEGRKTVSRGWSPIELLVHPGLPTLLVLGILLVLVAVVAFIVYRVVTRSRRRSRRAARTGGSYRNYRG